MERAAQIASGMTGRIWNADDIFIAMIALKFSRQSYNFKRDNLLDAAAYIGAWQIYIDSQTPTNSPANLQPETTKLVPPSLDWETSIDKSGGK